jgi:arylsulfatase A-like enzyme
MKRYLFLGSLALASASWAADTERPNIVFLLADDLGWADIAPGPTNEQRGSKYHDTPQISRLAKEGVSFQRATVQQNCAPTRAAILSGQYAARPGNGVFNVGSLARGATDSIIVPPVQRGALPPASLTLPKVLAESGYVTALLGKEHGFKADAAGFQIDLSCSKKVKKGGKGGQYFAAKDDDGKWHFSSPAYDRYAEPYTAEYVEKNLRPAAVGNDPKSLIGTPKHLTDAMADAAEDFIEEHAKGEKPFYMNVSFQAVHSPIIPRPDLAQKYAAITSDDLRHTNPKYAGIVQGLDEAVGRILRALDDPNGDGDKSDSIAGKTLVVFLSDNGGFGGQTNNSPLRGAKGMFYEGGVRVPLVMRLPGRIPAGSVTAEPVHAVDLYPTLAAFAGVNLPPADKHPIDGVSLASLASGKEPSLSRDALYWHFPGYMDTRQVPNSVIKKRVGDRWYKLVYYYEGQVFELYDLKDDEREQRNLLASSPSADAQGVAENLRSDLCKWLAETEAPLGTVRKTGEPVSAPIALADSLRPRETAIDGTPLAKLRYPEIGKGSDE